MDSKAENKLSVSCDQCGHTTKTESGMKLHKRKKHDINQIDGNSSISEIDGEDGIIQLCYSFSSLWDKQRLLQKLQNSWTEYHMKNILLSEHEKLSRKWTQFEIIIKLNKETNIMWPQEEGLCENVTLIT